MNTFMKLFDPLEIAGRRELLETGTSNKVFCPACGLDGFEMLTMNFGLCQRSVNFCKNGRTHTTSTRVKLDEVDRYSVLNILVTEVDRVNQRCVYERRTGTVEFCYNFIEGYTIEEWKNGERTCVLNDCNEATIKTEMLRHQSSLDYFKGVMHLQIIHSDKLIRCEFLPY